MHLESKIIVPQTTNQVWALFNDPCFLTRWDRSVEEIIPTSVNPAGAVGFTFDTIAPKKKGQKAGLRMSYRITEYIPDYQTKIQLEYSNMFRTAIWTMRVEPVAEGSLITCLVDLHVKLKYFFVVPMLYLNKRALLTDLEYLKKAIAQEYTA